MAAENVVVDFVTRTGSRLRALDGVTCEVLPNEILGVVGESGSGKSTLARVLTGYLEPNSGLVRFPDGTTRSFPSGARRRAPVARRDVQMIFQESATALNPRLRAGQSIAEALSEGRSVRNWRSEKVIDLLRQVDLPPEVAERRPAELSGGQRQRVAIARALAARPRVLVCDEAVSALDVSVRARILELLVRVRRELDLSIVFISHDLAVVSQLVDRVIVMYHGSVVECGSTRDVIYNPREDYTRKLIAAVPRLEREAVPATPVSESNV